jgi:hypothetical protein
MRRWFAEGIALVLVTLMGGAAKAQISLVPGPPTTVSAAPRFIASGDFNNDGVDDVVVANSASLVTILLGQAGLNYFPPGNGRPFNVGRTLYGMATGYWNKACTAGTNKGYACITDTDCPGSACKVDPFLDLAVVSYSLNRLFYPYGDGTGNLVSTSSTPSLGNNVAKTNIGPTEVAAGRFTDDSINGVTGYDLAVVDKLANRVSIFLNQGKGMTNPFGPKTDYPVGATPTRIVAAPLNGDVCDDVVAVNTGPVGADTISVLLDGKTADNKCSGAFGAAQPILVGPGARDVVAGKFNILSPSRQGQGADYGNAYDLAVLNSSNNQASFSVSILINKNDGTGAFNSGAGSLVQVACPRSIAGVAISCVPNFITAGDFNGDGLTDLAITVNTLPYDKTLPATAGLVVVLKGNGTGGFHVAGMLSVASNPQGVTSGCFTRPRSQTNPDNCVCDGGKDCSLHDVVVAFQRVPASVQILTAVKPVDLQNGTPCTDNGQCASGNCVDGVCCSAPSCTGCSSAGKCNSDGTTTCHGDADCPVMRCDIPGKAGSCAPPGDPGDRCTDPGQCKPPVTPGATPGPPPGICDDGFCCTAQCPIGLVCNTGICAPPSGVPGTPCNSDNDSQGQNQCALPLHCVDGVCCQSDTNSCPPGYVCNLPGFEGICQPQAPSPTAPPVTPTNTPTPQPTGRPCDNPAQCASNSCLDGVCCATQPEPGTTPPQCPNDATGNPQFCNISDSLGICAPKKDNDQSCTLDSDCVSGYCDPTLKVCKPAPTATPTGTPTQTSTPTPKPGDPCSNDNQCPQGFPCSTDEHVCCNGSPNCQPGYSCTIPGSFGYCTLVPASPTVTPLSGLGVQCTSNTECASGFCAMQGNVGVCCDKACTGTGQSCNSQGHCVGDVGTSCTANSDCLPLLECIKGTCTVPPSGPTPTPQTILASTSSNGGCSLNNGAEGNAAWLLAAVPLLLAVRRYRLHPARVRRVRGGR